MKFKHTVPSFLDFQARDLQALAEIVSTIGVATTGCSCISPFLKSSK
jgi:hypothetical protein